MFLKITFLLKHMEGELVPKTQTSFPYEELRSKGYQNRVKILSQSNILDDLGFSEKDKALLFLTLDHDKRGSLILPKVQDNVLFTYDTESITQLFSVMELAYTQQTFSGWNRHFYIARNPDDIVGFENLVRDIDNNFAEVGKYFGYPECCRNRFREDTEKSVESAHRYAIQLVNSHRRSNQKLVPVIFSFELTQTCPMFYRLQRNSRTGITIFNNFKRVWNKNP